MATWQYVALANTLTNNILVWSGLLYTNKRIATVSKTEPEWINNNKEIKKASKLNYKLFAEMHASSSANNKIN